MRREHHQTFNAVLELAGATRVSREEVKDELNTISNDFLDNFLKTALEYMMHSNRRTVTFDDVENTVRFLSMKIYGLNSPKIEEQIVLNKTKTETNIRNIIQENRNEIRVSHDAMVSIMFVLQSYLITRVQKAIFVAKLGNRLTVHDVDFINSNLLCN